MSSNRNELDTTLGGEYASTTASSKNPTKRTRGAFIVVVGPDGSGKTSVAQALLQAREGRYFHFRPPYRAQTMPRHPPVQGRPLAKDPGPAFPPLGWLRLGRSVVASWIGYLTAIRPTIARGELVVADRWIYGYLVQPRPLRFGGPGWLARLAIRVLPSPDLVVNLSAPVDVIHTRKSELSKNEIERELEAWQHLPTERLVTIDTSARVEKVIDEVHQHIAKVR
jgi:thymidylate kinase